MKTYAIGTAVGVLALGIMLTMSGIAMAQAAPLAEFAVLTGVTGNGFSGELRGTVPFVPVRGKRYGGWKGDWRYWSHGSGWHHYGNKGKYFPKKYRDRWGYGPGTYTCWSDGWRTYCGVY